MASLSFSSITIAMNGVGAACRSNWVCTDGMATTTFGGNIVKEQIGIGARQFGMLKVADLKYPDSGHAYLCDKIYVSTLSDEGACFPNQLFHSNRTGSDKI